MLGTKIISGHNPIAVLDKDLLKNFRINFKVRGVESFNSPHLYVIWFIV